MKNINEPIQTNPIPENEIDTKCYSSTGNGTTEEFVNGMFQQGGLPRYTNLVKPGLQKRTDAIHPFNSSS